MVWDLTEHLVGKMMIYFTHPFENCFNIPLVLSLYPNTLSSLPPLGTPLLSDYPHTFSLLNPIYLTNPSLLLYYAKECDPFPDLLSNCNISKCPPPPNTYTL